MTIIRLEWMIMLELLDETHKDAESFPYRQPAYPENPAAGLTVAVFKTHPHSDTLSPCRWHSR
jgi:hypothetical protein